MSGHTPGPWVVVTELRDTDEIICDMLNNGYVAITQGQKLANWRDDAALIAAAPDLLEALDALLIAYCDPGNQGSDHDEKVEAARAVIAKARGTA
ncbi:hypothetical protein OS670_19970 [Pseudomonadaceae bacterium T75]|nr:hypothetical protein OS670_19970 [Pseudomonadaceae bacterium T75]